MGVLATLQGKLISTLALVLGIVTEVVSLYRNLIARLSSESRPIPTIKGLLSVNARRASKTRTP